MNAAEPDMTHTATVVSLADSEKALIALAIQHDQAAFHKLYLQHVNRVYALCLRLTGSVSMAEEATQEVFLQVWRKLDSFAGNSSFATWLHTVATNTTLSYLRRQKSWLQVVRSRISHDRDGEDGGDGIDLQEAEQSTEPGRLHALLPKLPERARVVFVLHALEGYRHDQIGKALNITEGACKAHFHRARTLLTQWLTGED